MTGPGAGVDESVLELLDSHGGACAFLSAVLLNKPDAALASRLRASDLIGTWPLPDVAGSDGLDGRSHLAGWAEAVFSGAAQGSPEVPDESLIDEAVAEWMRLFRGPGPLQACPYESVHREEEKLTFGEQTVSVRRWYAVHGVEAPRLNVEPDDHLGLELAFVSHLCLSALDAAEAGDLAGLSGKVAALSSFLGEHLLVWADEVADAMITHAETGLYQGVGLLLRGACRSLQTAFR
ncbi:TorD/DmsD family molecular chaperone [Austwickia chelonae]|uniref:TorD/DmsD family molecular chaperone n=1 Tax=Austwickia chelonae TaxID=100225 RepID=UPI000E289149|nr:molecular chaperone TorD family protein [Austwickia chelonae]